MTRHYIVVDDDSPESSVTQAILDQLTGQGVRARVVAGTLDDSDGLRTAMTTLLQQRALLESELRTYRTLVEHSGDVVYVLDSTGHVTYTTNAMRNLLGYSIPDVMGRSFLDFVLPVQRDGAERWLTEQARTEATVTLPFELRHKDGTAIPVELTARTHFENGKPIYFVGRVHDIREHRRMQAEMLQRHRELEALYGIATIVTQSLDLEALMTNALERALEALDLDMGSIGIVAGDGGLHEWVSHNVTEAAYTVLPSLQLEAVLMPQILQKGDAAIFQDLAAIPGINQTALAECGLRSVAFAPLLAKSRVLGVLGVGSRERQFTESDRRLLLSIGSQIGLAVEIAQLYNALNDKVNELRQTNIRLEEATRHKSEFLANMSHELRTPLNAIIGFGEILQDQGFGALNDKQTRYVNNIVTSGNHLLALVNDVLDLAKVEAGKMELQAENFAPRAIIGDVQTILTSMAAKKHISVGIGDSPVNSVYGDRGKFKQIMYNLLSNAIKFTPDNGAVNVALAVVQDTPLVASDRRIGFGEGLRHVQSVPMLEVTVSDSGIGVKPEDHERIFEEFQMVDSAYSRKYQGTGIGLALSRRLVGLHGGRIWVESAGVPGEGSRFTFTIPLEPLPTSGEPLLPPLPDNLLHNSISELSPSVEAVLAAAAPSLITNGGAGQLALVVEDDDKAAELLALYLGQTGYRVERAATGEQALAKARELRPTLITLDIILPHLNGWEVLRQLKADPQTEAIPVVVVSMVDNREMSFALGAVACFVKPVRRDDLANKLADLRKNGLLRPQPSVMTEDHPAISNGVLAPQSTAATQTAMFSAAMAAAADYHHRTHTTQGSPLAGEERPLRAVVIDDDPADAALLCDILSAAGLDVTQAQNEEDGWQYVQVQQPDLVVLDLMMPDVDGFALLHRLRQNPHTRDVPVFIFTAKDLSASERDELVAQAEAVLSKNTGDKPRA